MLHGGIVAFAAIAICFALFGRASAAVCLSEDGKAVSTIVYSPAQGIVLQEAVQDFAEHLKEMTGAAIPVVTSIEDVKTPYRILIGKIAVAEHKLSAEANALAYPDYIYRVTGSDLLIFGHDSSPKGTANGIYGFLQDELGVRWFAAGDLWRVILKRASVLIKKLDKKGIPSFPGRDYSFGYRREHFNWLWGRRRMRMTEWMGHGQSKEPYGNFNHYLYLLFPTKVYGKTHPEYYPLRAGKRFGTDTLQDWSPCFSNPDLVDIAEKAARSFFKASPFNQSFSLSINDTTLICQCDKCMHPPKGNWFQGEAPTHCDVYFHYFVNEVARRVRKDFPDRSLCVLAYNDINHPPFGPVEPNVHVVICSDIAEYYDRAYREKEEKRISAWENKGCTLGFWHYAGLPGLRPRHHPHLLDRELKDKHKRGFRKVHSEAAPYWPANGPMMYLMMRLSWDVDLNVDDLLKEYFATLYGPADGPMSRLYSLFDEIHMRPRSGGFLYEYNKLPSFRPVTTADLILMRKHLKDAQRLAPEGLIAQRVNYVANGLQVSLTMLEAYCHARDLKKPAQITEKAALARLEAVERSLSILDNHDTLYDETLASDKSRYFLFQIPRFQDKGLRHAWKAFVRTGIGDALAGLYRWNSRNQPGGELANRIRKAVDAYTRDDYQRAVFRIKVGEMKLGPNLVANPGFEERTAAGKHPTGPDWKPAELDGWSLWQYAPDKGRFDVSEKDRHGGRYSGRIKGVGHGCYITTIPNVKEGECYYAGAWVKSLAFARGDAKTDISLEVQWFDDKGAWTQQGAHYRSSLVEEGKWTKLEFLAQIPKGVSTAVLLLWVKGLEAQQEVFFDDVTFQKDIGKARLSDADLGPNMLKNGGFEQVYGVAPHEECPPGREKGFPYGWYGTPAEKAKGIMDTVETDPHTGRRAARMRGTGENAYFLQPSAPLGDAAGIHLCEAWAKNSSSSANTRVYMEIRWYDKAGWMWGKSYFNAPLKETGQWSRMEVIAKPPEGAIQMAFFLMADNLGPDDEVLFDDAMVRRINDD